MATINLTVDTFEDQNDGSSFRGLSLRDAILIANANPENQYEIILPAGTYNLTIKNVLSPSTDQSVDADTLFRSRIATGDLDITGNVTIIGDDSSNTIIDAKGLEQTVSLIEIPEGGVLTPEPFSDRVFDVLSAERTGSETGGSLILENVTVRNGMIKESITNILTVTTIPPTPEPPNDPTVPVDPVEPVVTVTEETLNVNIETISNGGAINIEVGGNASFINSIIENSSSSTQAGGIYNQGTLTLEKSIVQGHQSGDNGGGVYNTGTLVIRNSAIINNFAEAAAIEIIEGGGGGVLNEAGGTLIMVNTTVSGNRSATGENREGPGDGGGGILSRGTTRIINSTIVNNRAQIGSGIYSETTTANTILYNTIVGDNIGSPDLDGFFDGRSAYNLVTNANGSILDANKNNIVGGETTDRPLTNIIGPLQDNGGSTPTHALLSGSLAIDAGDSSMVDFPLFFPDDPAIDQRGFQRIVGNAIDIGAYESGATEVISPTPVDTNTGTDNNQGNDNVTIDPPINDPVVNDNSGVNIPDVQEFVNDNLIEDDSLLNSPVFRFQNKNVAGTYLYAGSQESQNIRNNFSNFQEEGIAFNVSDVPKDDLIAIYRFQNIAKTGTYLYAGAQERQSILRNNRNFVDEGIAFYVYGADANKGKDIYRFQSLTNEGTYLFVGETEKNNILANFSSSYRLEGVAFEAG
ncbi:alkaline phosphatase [Geminocystis sp. NIES-3708]|uniref:choice-of-anchor Q domain-containing protein n=1 Tax=Geminocystis sp. NIES-3708 TaxID=1615909 RepID=UPI0005FC3F81|nr:choice-of-anchor Q domain-containing protein [Geminocystis sp. NIES-3708]BAQ61689.1 alkaline phosphatase [Geminocystis sp. NIES-3708]